MLIWYRKFVVQDVDETLTCVFQNHFLVFIRRKLMAFTTIINSNYNNEPITIWSENGFSILFRDLFDTRKSSKLVNDINKKDSITKNLRNIINRPEFHALEKQMISEGVVLNKNTTLYYVLPSVFSNYLRVVYVHKGLLALICIINHNQIP
jgi:hypothetical protein